jgi:hypothetical protein
MLGAIVYLIRYNASKQRIYVTLWSNSRYDASVDKCTSLKNVLLGCKRKKLQVDRQLNDQNGKTMSTSIGPLHKSFQK